MTDNIVQFKRDKYEALMRDSEEFEGYLIRAVRFGLKKEIPIVMMIGHLSRIISDLDFNAVTFEPEDGA